ncbi:MAG: hypothetical protein C0595_02890 [Marinilabiliales bacterium]|nr:MAG: hypothetical protein C0595_02890 [Marinilabiliales bacterium]
MKTTITPILIALFSFIGNHSYSQFTSEDFVGTWVGYISSEYGDFGGYSDPMTMVIYDNGFYTETSGHLMPTIYPNSQESEFDAETNRYHWWYLQTVYAGQYFYQHFLYEIVYFENDTLEMHYNYWDDMEPHPEVGTIFLVKQTTVGVEDDIYTNNIERKLLRVVDIMGRETSVSEKGKILIYQYDDGSTEKKFIR